MSQPIHCPTCGSELELSQLVRTQLETEMRAGVQAEVERKTSAVIAHADEQIRAKQVEVEGVRAQLALAAVAETELLKARRELEECERRVAVDVERRVAEEATKIRAEEAKAAGERQARANAEADERVRVVDKELAEARAKLGDASAKEAELLRARRELDEREGKLALELEVRLIGETKRIRDEEAKAANVRAEAAREAQSLKDEESRIEKQALHAQVADLHRRIQQGSQQLQGEAQEVLLSALLVEAFGDDDLEDVGKGTSGADVRHRVRGVDGRDCGTIVWESKRTKVWSDDWLAKARDDQRAASAACAVIVTQAMPRDVKHFGLKDGVWVCAWTYASALGAALRATLVEVALARRTADGRGEKMQMLYEYLTGTEFRNRVGGFVEAFKEMQDDLEQEKRAMLMRWKRRERLMQRARENITAFYGDLGGIAGRQLKDLPALALAPADDGVGMDLEGADSDEPSSDELKAVLFELVPEDGSPAGNGSLSEKFIERVLAQCGVLATVTDYERCKAALLAEGRLRRGKGKGGSVCRAVAANGAGAELGS